MRLVREHINEIFTEESDPIKDLGIGLINFWKIENEKINKNPEEFVEKFFSKYSFYYKHKYAAIASFTISDAIRNIPVQIAFNNSCRAFSHINDTKKDMLKARKIVAEVLKEHFYINVDPLNEAFTEDSDPIHDMGIGIRQKIDSFVTELRKRGFIKGENISKDLKINAEYVNFSSLENTNLPSYIKFGKITGQFSCVFKTKNQLKYLPDYVGGTLTIYTDIIPDFTFEDIRKKCAVRLVNILTYHYPDYHDFHALTLKDK